MDCFIKQIGENDCAFASLKMLLAHYTKNKEFLFLKQDLNSKGYSLWQIIQIAKKYGFEIQGVKITDMSRTFTLDSQPFLALFSGNHNDATHLVFVKKIRRKRVLIYDPKCGKYWMKLSKFYEKWSGIYLRVISYRPVYFKSENVKIVKKTSIVIGNIIKALSSVVLVVGFYFVKEDSYFILPLSLVVGFVLLSILSNFIIKRSSYKFDKNISTRVYSFENNNFVRKYEDLLKYKMMVFTTPSILITNVLLILFFVTITCLNDLKNVAFFGVLFSFGIIDYFVFKKIKSVKSQKIETLEAKVSQHGISEKDFVYNYQLLSKETDKFATIVLLRKYFVGFFIFALTFVLMAISKTISLNFLIFNFLIYDIVYQYFQKIISYNENNEEFKQLKAKFVSLLSTSK